MKRKTALIIVLLMAVLPAFRFALEYAEQENRAEIMLSYGGESLDPTKGMDELSRKLLTRSAAEVSHQYENGENRIRIKVK